MVSLSIFRKMIVVMLLMVWGVMHWNGVANRHHHIDDKGNLVSHAHPVQDGAEDHSHSEDELVFLDLISNPSFQFTYPKSLVPEPVKVVFIENRLITDDRIVYIRKFSSDFLRGPPVIS